MAGRTTAEPRSARRMAPSQFHQMRLTIAAIVAIHGATAYSLSADELNVTYQCFERKTKKPIAASSIDLSTEEIGCELITPEKTTTPSEKKNVDAMTQEKSSENEDTPSIKPTINFEIVAWQSLPRQTQEQVNYYPRNFPLAARRAINLARGSVVAFNGGLRTFRLRGVRNLLNLCITAC